MRSVEGVHTHGLRPRVSLPVAGASDDSTRLAKQMLCDLPLSEQGRSYFPPTFNRVVVQLKVIKFLGGYEYQFMEV